MLSILTSQVALVVKNSPANAGFRVRSMGWEDPLEKGMATHSSILVWRISWTEEPCGLHTHRVAKRQTQLEERDTHTSILADDFIQKMFYYLTIMKGITPSLFSLKTVDCMQDTSRMALSLSVT